MNLGKRLMELRKKQNLSQEALAEKLGVTRQTVSKWETDQSAPDFDKVLPLCEVFGITTDELFKGEEISKEEINNNIKEDIFFNKQEELEINNRLNEEKKKTRAIRISISIFLYFLSCAWIMVSIPVFKMNPVLATSIFIVICGLATCIIIYTNIVYKKDKTRKEEVEDKLYKQIDDILGIFTLIIYLIISFITFRWDIT
ncbi:MAG TPA: hypothetical protein DCE23_01500, partial [Firmicutes bacterium]|nr:hypothetical protein [Bacillota bacterium]